MINAVSRCGGMYYIVFLVLLAALWYGQFRYIEGRALAMIKQNRSIDRVYIIDSTWHEGDPLPSLKGFDAPTN